MTYVQRMPAFHLPRFSPVLPLIVAFHIAFIYALNFDVTINRPHVPPDLIAIFLPAAHEKLPEPELPKPGPVQNTRNDWQNPPIPGPVELLRPEDPVDDPIVQPRGDGSPPTAPSVQRLLSAP